MMESNLVFLDTQVYVQAQMDFLGTSMTTFERYCGDQNLKHITTSVVVKEVEGKIKEALDNAMKNVADFRREARMLARSSMVEIKGLFQELDQALIVNQANETFQTFLAKSRANVLPVDQVSVEEIFDMYFKGKPPFGAGKKKAEFPDAFSMVALNEFASSHGTKIYLVSHDQDLKAYCAQSKHFVYVESLNKLLDQYNSHDAARKEFITEYLEENEEKINRYIKRQIEHADFYNDASWEDSRVSSFNVLDVESGESLIIYADADYCIVELDVDVVYQARVTGPDMSSADYDHKAQQITVTDEMTITDSGILPFKVEVRVDYSVINSKFQAEDLNVNVLHLVPGIRLQVAEVVPYDDEDLDDR